MNNNNNNIDKKLNEWSFDEEIQLLDAMIICGPDNWDGISNLLNNTYNKQYRNPDECKKYYFDNFIFKPKYNDLINIINNTNHTDNCNILTTNNNNSAKIITNKLNNYNNKFENSNYNIKEINDNDIPCTSSTSNDIFNCDKVDNKFYHTILCDIKQEFDNNDISFMNNNYNFDCDINNKLINLNFNENCNDIGCNLLLFNDSFDNIINNTNEKNNQCHHNFSFINNYDNILINNIKIEKENYIDKNNLSSNFNYNDCIIDNILSNDNKNDCDNLNETLISNYFNYNSINIHSNKNICNTISSVEEDTVNLKIEIEESDNYLDNIEKIDKLNDISNENNYYLFNDNDYLDNKYNLFDNTLNISIDKSTNVSSLLNNDNSRQILFDDNSIDNLSLISSNNFNILRNEFNIEFDNKAEELLTSLNNNSNTDNILLTTDNLIMELSFTIIKNYNFRLSERLRRKRIICHYNLHNPLKTFSWYNKCKSILRENYKKNVLSLIQLMYPKQFDDILKNFKKIDEIKNNIYKLIEYRQQGITRLNSVQLYEDLKKDKEESFKKLKKIVPVTFFDEGLPVIASSSRKSAPPISIINMAGYSKLDECESEFCSVNRIFPESYLQFKETLINECKKKDGIKLAQARLLLKIDVNKTRKIFNLLIDKQLIWQPPNG